MSESKEEFFARMMDEISRLPLEHQQGALDRFTNVLLRHMTRDQIVETRESFSLLIPNMEPDDRKLAHKWLEVIEGNLALRDMSGGD